METNSIFLSDTKVYTDRVSPVTVYTINYTAVKSVAEKYNEYLNYMLQTGFSFGNNGQDVKNHSLYGTKDGDSLLVSVSSLEGKTIVQLSYTEN